MGSERPGGPGGPGRLARVWARARRWWLGAGALRRGHDAELGRWGEDRAARFLRRKGYRVVARNVGVRGGEIDLLCVAPDEATIVVVEVKTRQRRAGRTDLATSPEANVTLDKQRRLSRLAARLAAANGWTGRAIRIDVVAVDRPVEGGAEEVRHYEGITRR